MAIYFSEKLKQFRKARDLTQEQIADIFHVSPQAVSRWETDVSFPDIQLLPAIADFFKVTVDELLGVNILKDEQRIAEIQDLLKEKHHKGLIDDAIEICRNALKEFPNNYSISYELAHFLTDKSAAIGYNGEEGRKYNQESVSIYEHILEYCTDDDIRWKTIQGLAYGYNYLGETEKVKEMTQRLPHILREIVYASVCGEDEKLKATSDNIKLFCHMLTFDLIMFGWRIDKNTSIQLIKKAILIIEMLFENGDYGSFNYQLYFAYENLAKDYMYLKDFDNALECIEKSANYAIASDTLPEDFKHTSIAVEHSSSKKSDGVKNYDSNTSYLLLNSHLSNNLYDPIREHERFKAVVAELEKYAKKEV